MISQSESHPSTSNAKENTLSYKMTDIRLLPIFYYRLTEPNMILFPYTVVRITHTENSDSNQINKKYTKILISATVCKWHLNTRQKSPVFLNTVQKSRVFKWLGCMITIIMLWIIILMYYHLKTGHWKVWYSDESCIQVFGIQMVTVNVTDGCFKLNETTSKNDKTRLYKIQKCH